MSDTPSKPNSQAARRNREPVALGRWVLHPDTGVLRSGDEEQRLTGRALHVLLVLIDAGGGAVSRDDLLDAVWGEHYPTDSVVSRAIADLRSAFGESAGDGETIRTIPKFGYQLVVEVGAAATPDERPAQSLSPWFAGAAVLVAAIALIAMLASRPGPPGNSSLALPALRPLTSAPGLEHQPRIVPGSDWVVYAALRPDHGDWDLFRVSLDDNMTQAIAATPGVTEHGPAVSPDGESIAYTRLSGEGCEVVEQPIVLGAPVRVAGCTAKFPTLVDWSPDGSTLAFTSHEADDADGYRRIHALDRDSGERRALSRDVSPTGSDFYPRFSPSGRHVAFLRGEPQPDHRSSLWVVDTADGSERRLTEQPAQLGGMTWLDDAHVLYSINDAGRFELRRLSLDGGDETTLDSGDLVQPHYDPAGERLVATHRRSERDLAILSPGTAMRSIASSTSDDHHARWSPDGRFVVFVSRRSGHDELWLASTDDQQVRRLTRFDGATVRYPAWHPDGQRILFTVQADAAEQLHEIDLITGQIAAVAGASPGATTPAWLPDGSRRVYGCGEATSDGICIGDDTGGERQIAQGYFRPTPIGDDAIVVLDRDGRLVRMSLDGDAGGIAWDGLPEGGRLAWDITSGALVYAMPGDIANGGRVIRRQLDSGEETVLYEGRMPLADGSIDALPDGRVVITRFDAASDDLVWMRAPLSAR